MKKYAFTLAEVLITLGIIGIVAAMTMPALVANYQKKVTVAKLKKVSSTLSQGCKMALADDGVSEIAETSFYSSMQSSIPKYYKILGNVSRNVSVAGVTNFANGSFAYNGNYNFKLADGTDVTLYYPPHTYSQDKLSFAVNINPGRKEVYKNVDLFAIRLNKNCALDLTEGGHWYSCSHASAVQSFSGVNECFNSIVSNGWEIKYDFNSVKRAQDGATGSSSHHY